MTAPKRIDLARMAAALAVTLEKEQPHQVSSVNAEIWREDLDGSRFIRLTAMITVPGPRRRAADDEPETVDVTTAGDKELQTLPVVGDVPGPAPRRMKRGQTYSTGPAVEPRPDADDEERAAAPTRLFDEAKPDADPAGVEG